MTMNRFSKQFTELPPERQFHRTTMDVQLEAEISEQKRCHYAGETYVAPTMPDEVVYQVIADGVIWNLGTQTVEEFVERTNRATLQRFIFFVANPDEVDEVIEL